MASRFGQKDRNTWHCEELTNRANMASFPKRNGVIMFPSSHDITPFNLDACIRTISLILSNGNQLLIVTKPRLNCITSLITELIPWQSQILFRFTITSLDREVASFWEPGAPEPSQRLACLKNAHLAGYKTSVSVEPMLQGRLEAIQVVNTVAEHVTDTIWVGKMNQARQRVSVAFDAKLREIQKLQSDAEIMKLYHDLKTNLKVRWKDSIMSVISRNCA
jgi:DNA repair photolyase